MAANGVATADLADLIVATRRHLPKKTLNNTLKYQTYEVLGYLMANGRYEVGGGRGVEERVRIDEMGTAQHVLPFQERALSNKDILAKMEVDFVNLDAYWMISDIELGQNRSEADEVVDLITARRAGTMESMGNVLEEKFWAAPDAADATVPWGLKYWIVNRSSAGEGFDGGAPTGFTTVGAINPTTYSRWKNYAAGGAGYYEDIDSTFESTCRTAFRKVNFKAPRRIDLGLSPKQKLRLYANSETIGKMEARAESMRDNYSAFKLLPGYDQLIFNRLPVQYIALLDDDDVDPLYMVDMSTFKVKLMKGRTMKEAKPMRRATMPDVAINWIFLSYLYRCGNRRRNAVIHK
jgi:hypothetical protein